MRKGCEKINRRLKEAIEKEGILVAAHRGTCGGNIIENTTDAYECAIKHRADIVEMDAVRSADGELFMFHDGNEKRLLGVDKNIKWNNPGARNLGACFADTEKIILADIDWLIPQATLQICLEKEIPNNSFIVFENPARGSVLPNIYCTKKQTFLRYGGYNESYRGFYGDDIFHRRKLLQNNVSFIRPNLKVIGLKDKILLDEHFLSRDLTKAKKVLAKNPDLSNTGNILQYPWHFEQEREYKQ